MSWDVELRHPDGNIVEVDSHVEGGIYTIGGSGYANLRVTYNYSWFYYRFLSKRDGLHWLGGKRAGDTIEALENAVRELGTNKYKDYWSPTPGNAGHALNVLLGWAKDNPDAVWYVD